MLRPCVGHVQGQDAPRAGQPRVWIARRSAVLRLFRRTRRPEWHRLLQLRPRRLAHRALNSNCDLVGGCGAGSPQDTWLRDDLRRSRAKCTLAYWHHPRFSSGPHGNDPNLITLWQALYVAGAEIVLSGHDHDYERFRPQTPDGVLDRARGIQEFVVGTGGRSLFPFSGLAANSAVRDDNTYGVLRLRLAPGRYSFRLLPVLGTFTDSGGGVCH